MSCLRLCDPCQVSYSMDHGIPQDGAWLQISDKVRWPQDYWVGQHVPLQRQFGNVRRVAFSKIRMALKHYING